MPKGYIIVFYSKIQNPDALAEYAKIASPAVVANGGRFLARGGRVKSLEGGIEERSVIIEFDNFEAAVAHYDSPNYQEALKVLGDSAVRDMRVIEGID